MRTGHPLKSQHRPGEREGTALRAEKSSSTQAKRGSVSARRGGAPTEAGAPTVAGQPFEAGAPTEAGAPFEAQAPTEAQVRTPARETQENGPSGLKRFLLAALQGVCEDLYPCQE